MKRLLAVLTMAIAVAGTSLPARAVNLHNGVIVFRNNTTTHVTVYVHHAMSFNGQYIELVRDIPPGGMWYSTACCYAAGSPYVMDIRRDNDRLGNNGAIFKHPFTPHLCNRNGIPYGFFEATLNNDNSIHNGASDACYWGAL